VRVVDAHGSCNSRFLVLSILLSWVSVSVVSGMLMGRGRCCSLGILVLSIVHLRLRRLHLWRLHLSLLLRIWCSVLMNRGLRVLGLCRRSWLYTRPEGGMQAEDMSGTCHVQMDGGSREQLQEMHGWRY
jgi:hypothetical protein